MMLQTYTREYLLEKTSTRQGEQKLGEVITCSGDGSLEQLLTDVKGRFVLVGVPEDIGVRGNHGVPGAASCWELVLPAILNVQVNSFLDHTKLVLLGHLEVADLQKRAKAASLNDLRELCYEVDKRLEAVIEQLIRAEAIPIVIGGGHNNSYGCLAGAHKALATAINCLNVDPHADFRPLEGRHSGNGFSYAFEHGHLNRYSVYGLHESYNNSKMLKAFDDQEALNYITFERILQAEPSHDLLQEAITHLQEGKYGLEIDLDSIELMPVSAKTPSGFRLNDVRRIVHRTGQTGRCCYLHIAEGAPKKDTAWHVGKAISYLITDFIKSQQRID